MRLLGSLAAGYDSGLSHRGERGDLELSIFLFGLGIREYTPLIEAAEDCGYSAVWLGDHLVAPEHTTSRNPYSDHRGAGFDPLTPLADVWTALAHAACSTTTIRLGTGVYILPLRDVFVSARAAASVQELSRGRVVFGVGTGWLREEFEAVGASFGDRAARTDEAIEAMRLLWTGRVVEYHGGHVSFPAVRLAPPIEVPIPVFGGGLSSRALERAARLCDGWFSPACSVELCAAAREEIEAHRRRIGRTSTFTYVVRPSHPVDAQVFAEFSDAGFDHLALSLKQLGSDAQATLAQRIATLQAVADRFGIRPPRREAAS
jgi:probable F420-dependent oxidoreductase